MTAQTLGEHCLALANAAEEAMLWAQSNADVVRSELSGLQLELRKSKRAFLQCARAAERKMCAGVFGPSQAGKSYLISALARDRTGGLTAVFGDRGHDFISEVNPEGGKESTGLVTRFTMTRPNLLPEGFPVQIRLLTETDLVKIIANTYYSDCEHREVPDAKAVTDALSGLRARQGKGSPHIDLDALEDLREYLTRDFQAKPRVQELERSFWPTALEIGQKLNLEGRIDLYSVIWDQIPKFTELLRLLTQGLEKLAYASEAFCRIDALIPRTGSIIDVAMLEGLGERAEGPLLQIRSASGSEVYLPRAVVTALTAELAIVMKEKPDDYFDYTDLLDFPGYRSRYKFTEVRKELEKPGMLKELFLRGKVAYLFQRYCAEKELTGMLLCIGPSNQEVQDLPGVINEWIISTHGELPEVRRNKAPSLFFILTKFDMEFEDKAGAPSVEARWDNRLHASLLDFFGKQYDWPGNWDGEKAFDNLFLLRNPNFKFKTALEYGDDNRETGIRKDAQKLVDALRIAFLNSPLVARHFQNPELSWEAAMRLNDGGITLIRDTLRPLCNPEIKKTQITTALRERCAKLARRLGAFYRTDDKEEERRQKEQFARGLLASFSRLLQNQLIGEFLSRLIARDQDLYDLYFEARRRFLAADGTNAEVEQPVSIGGSVSAADAFAELFGEEAAPALPEAGKETRPLAKHLSEASYFTDLIISSWCDKLRAFSDDPRVQQRYGVSSGELSKFVSELSVGLTRLGIAAEMEKAMEEASAYANTSKERIVWQQVARAGAMLNAYLSWLGFNPRLFATERRTITMLGKQYVLFEPPMPVKGGFPELPELQPPFEKTWCLDWMRALYTLMLDNVDFDGARLFDREQNASLGSIIKRIDFTGAEGGQ